MNICKTTCTVDADCVVAQRLQRRHLLEEADRRGLRGGDRVRLRLLRAGGLLRQRLHGHLPVVRAGRQRSAPARSVPAGQAPTPPTQCTDAGVADLRHQRPLQRQRRLPAVRERHGVRRRQLHRLDADAARAPATAPASARRSRPRSAIRTGATPPTRSARPPAPSTADCASPNICVEHELRQQADRRRPARPGASATRASARRASAARPPARAPAVVRDRRGARHLRVGRPAPIPSNQCTDGRRLDLRHRRVLRRQRRLPQVRLGDPVRGRDLHRHDPDAGGDAATAAGPAARPTTSSCSPYVCGTGACKTTCASNADCLGTELRLHRDDLHARRPMLTVKLQGRIRPARPSGSRSTLQITNNSTAGTTAIPMSDLTVRYWYTYDTTPVVGTGSRTATTRSRRRQLRKHQLTAHLDVAVSPAKTRPTSTSRSGSPRRAGNLNAGGRPASSSSSCTRTTGRNFTRASDYSYNGATAFTTTTKVTVYRVGTLVYGTEP